MEEYIDQLTNIALDGIERDARRLGVEDVRITTPGCGRRMNPRYPPLIYVAGAYAGDVSANIIKAERVSILLIRNGWHVFTPHKNTAGYENYEDLPKSTWLEMDLNTLARCDALYVMNNWRTSPGTKGEIAEAHRLGLPILWEDIMLPDCEEMNVRWWLGEK